MTTSIKELREQARLNELVNNAYHSANIKQETPTQQVINNSGETSNVLLAINNLMTITDQTTAQNIIDSIKDDENKINYLNKYFTTFKNSLLNQKIVSLGDFQKRFNNFYVQDVGRTTQPIAATEISKIKDVNIDIFSIKRLTELSTKEIDEIFRNIYKRVNGVDPENGMVFQYRKKKGELSDKKEIKDAQNLFITFKGIRRAKDVNEAKISYILENVGASYVPALITWKGPPISGSGIQNSNMSFPKSKTLKKKSVLFI